jgi:hypothetical protein
MDAVRPWPQPLLEPANGHRPPVRMRAEVADRDEAADYH